MNLKAAASIGDLRSMARRRLPRMAFDFMDGGAESERNMARNREAFAETLLAPRALVDVTQRDQSMQLFGKSYATAIGIAPIGLANLIWPGADLLLARAAAKARVPFILSTAATTPLEAVAEAAAGYGWYQLYVSTDEAITTDLLCRAETAGYEVLVVTVDVPVPGKRDRDIRNGFQLPFRISPGTLLDFCLHPRWSLTTAMRGAPRFENLARYAPPGSGAQSLAAFMAAQVSGSLDWSHLRRIRDRWKGRLLVKGVMSPGDAATCVRHGVDGIIVSNHGGRQADFAAASLEALPLIRQAVGGSVAVLVDSGIRRGADVVRAIALGADYTFSGRCFLYGVAAGEGAGVDRAFDILRQEIDRTLGQIGRPKLSEVDEGILWDRISVKEGAPRETLPPAFA